MSIKSYLYTRKVNRLKRQIAGLCAQIDWWAEVLKISKESYFHDEQGDRIFKLAELKEELRQLTQ